MTIGRRDPTFQPLFNQWLQRQPSLDSIRNCIAVTDCDLIIHQYSNRTEKIRFEYEISQDHSKCVDHIMIVEIKTFLAQAPKSQRDTLYLMDALLREAGNKQGRRRFVEVNDRRMNGFIRYVRCYGAHVLTLSGACPDSSDAMWWDNQPVDQAILLELLRFDRDPDYPLRTMDTRRHHIVKRNTLGGLFPLEIA